MFTLQTKVEVVSDIVLAAIFVGSFYFTISKDIEGQAVTSNINHIVGQVLPEFNWQSTAIGRKIQPIVCSSLNTVSVTNAQSIANDQAVQQNNDALIKKSIKAFSVLIATGLLLVWYFYSKRTSADPVSLPKVAKHCLVILMTIAVAEYFFFRTAVGGARFADDQDILGIYMGRPRFTAGLSSS